MATITSINIAFYNCTKDTRKKLGQKLNRKMSELVLNEGFYKAQVSDVKVSYPYVRFDVENVTADSKEQLEALTQTIISNAMKACNFKSRTVSFRELTFEIDTPKGSTTRTIGRRAYKKMVKHNA